MNSSEFMNRLFFALLLISLTLFAGMKAVAQDAQQTGTQQTLLPEIDPQDIEIRSQFQARFPGLRRQPILGFNPRPRVFQIDPNRTPFFEDEETVVANLPIGVLDRPEPPRYMPLGYSEPKNGFARAGIGSYFSPELDVFAIGRINDKNRVSASLNHLSTSGHLDDYTDSYRNSELGMNSVHMVGEKTTVQSNIGIKSSFSHYPGLISLNNEPTDLNSRVENFGFKGGLKFDRASTSLSGFNFALQGGVDEFDLTSEVDQMNRNLQEWNFATSAQYSRLEENVEEVHRLKVDLRFGGTDRMNVGHRGWSISRVSANYERLFNYKTDVKASLGLAGVTDAVNDFTFYLSPDVTVTHNLFAGLDLRGHLSGTPRYNSWDKIYSENPFVNFGQSQQHSFEWLSYAEAIIEPLYGTALIGGVSYQNVKNYLYYSQNPGMPLPSPEYYYSTEYRNANIFKIYGSFSQDLKPDVIWIQADGAWQRARLSNDEKIPFIESLSIKGTVAFRPFSQLVVEGWGEYVGSRDDSEGNTLSSFINLGGRFEISLGDRLGVYGKLVNLLDEEYELWQGYPERGFQGYIGITYLF